MQTSFALSPDEALAALLSSHPPVLLDARRPQAVQDDPWFAPQTRRAEPDIALSALPDLSAGVIVICAHGHHRSQMLAARLRAQGYSASIVSGGHDDWQKMGLPRVRIAFGSVLLGKQPTTWVTCRRPGIDHVACAWLVSRFLDTGAQHLFADADQISAIAEAMGALTVDMQSAGVELAGMDCSFDGLLQTTGLIDWPPLRRLAAIVRAADSGSLSDENVAAGLRAISFGLSHRHGNNDQAMLLDGFRLLDDLLAWIGHGSVETRHLSRRGA